MRKVIELKESNILENKIFNHKTIYCSYANFEKVKKKFPNKTVVPTQYCCEKFCTYIKKYPRGVFNIKIEDWSIWTPAEFPYFIKRVR